MPTKHNYFCMSCDEIRAMRKKGKRATVHVWIMKRIMYWLSVIMLVILALLAWLYVLAFADNPKDEHRKTSQEMVDDMRARQEIFSLLK